MEEESEEAEEELQDSEYDGYWSDEEDRAIFGQFVVEPLFDVSNYPKTPRSASEYQLAKQRDEASSESLIRQYELETQKLFLQPDQQSNASLATVAVNYGIQDNANVLLDLKANKDQDIVLLNERILKIEAESQEMKKKTEKTEAAIEEMAAENQELRQKLEAMAKKIEVLEGTK